MMNKIYKLLPLLVVLLSACSGNNKKDLAVPGSLYLNFNHTVDGKALVVDEMRYKNAAGNTYMITEIQWFLSRIQLLKADGSSIAFPIEPNIHYVDTDLPETQVLMAQDNFPTGEYTALRFTFGLNETDNTSLRFVNPPESFMFWPDYLGGGYHYLKLNGKWINAQGLPEPFNFHLGIGQIYDSTALKSAWVKPNDCCANNHCEGFRPPVKMMPVKAFVQNFFEVTLPLNIEVRSGETTELQLEMQVDKWFDGRHAYDHNLWGGSIMQLQPAMKQGCENGQQVFKLHQLAPRS